MVVVVSDGGLWMRSHDVVCFTLSIPLHYLLFVFCLHFSNFSKLTTTSIIHATYRRIYRIWLLRIGAFEHIDMSQRRDEDDDSIPAKPRHSSKIALVRVIVLVVLIGLRQLSNISDYLLLPLEEEQGEYVEVTTSCAHQQRWWFRRRQRPLTSSSSSSAPNNTTTAPRSICQALSHGSLSTSSLWKAHVSQILEASIHPLDATGYHRLWQEQLLQVTGPSVLDRGLIGRASLPQLQTVISILNTRRRALYDEQYKSKQGLEETTPPNNNMPPPLLVAVMGGSVPEGRGCNVLPSLVQQWLAFNNVTASPQLNKMQGKACTWPYRLQLLADAFLGTDVVRIFNLAVGGTGSSQALSTLEYRLYADPFLIQHGGPDVVVNGFAVNDNLPAWGTDPNTTNSSLHWSNTWQVAQAFVHTVIHESKPCHKSKPMMVFVDDYMGNQNAEVILAEDIRSDNVRMLSDLHEFLYISATVPARHLVMADETETAFTPKWTNPPGTKRIVEGHYGQPGHQHVANTMAYALLKSAVDYCAHQEFQQPPSGNSKQLSNSQLVSPITEKLVIQSPNPPVVDDNTTLMSLNWASQAARMEQDERSYCASANAMANPCSFGFVATPAGSTPSKPALQGYMRPFLLDPIADNTGWYVTRVKASEMP
jgi:hypothetical protein